MREFKQKKFDLKNHKKVLKHMKKSTKVFKSRVSFTKKDIEGLKSQDPYAVVITCSDSRVSPLEIFNASLGELFVIQTAGNTVSDFELGSIEYAVADLNAKLIVILGHTGCGAIKAAMSDHKFDGYLSTVMDEINDGLKCMCGSNTNYTTSEAEILNVKHTASKCRKSKVVKKLVKNGDVKIVGAIYDIPNSKVDFFDC